MMLRLMSRAPVLLAMLVLVVGCATPRVQVPEPLALPPPPEQATDSALRAARTVEQATMQVRETPAPPAPDGIVSAGSDVGDDIPPGLSGPPVSINVTNVPIPTFVNDVLGETLNLTFQVDPKIESLNELVTVRTSRPQQPVELFRLARQILADYGIEMLVEGDVVRLRMAPAGSRIEPPLIYSGRALPDVPVTHRPVFYLMELDAIRATEASRWLKAIYGDDVAIEASNERNALLISGRPAEVRQAVEAIQVFDRPYMRGRESIRLEPAFLSAQELSSKLTQMLVAEGYGAADTLGAPASVLVLPVPAVNSVILFAGDRELLRHAVDWARELDRPNPAAGANSIFYYPVKNTKAADIADVLGGAGGSTIAAPQDPDTATAAAAPTRRANAGRSLVVDEPRNALIFQGDPAEWERLLPLIRQMDREARQVMIEMTIAEVTLDDNEEFGLSWFAKGDTGRFNGRLDFGSLPTSGEGLGGSGLTYLLDVAGQSRALLKAFADDQRVSILSTPRLLVKSGEVGRIDVGTEVPIITARQTSPQQVDGTNGLLQSIQYRKTGIILTIEPTVYSEDRVDIELSQEVSEVLPLSENSEIGSPSIFNRTIETSLSLRDGGSIVIGGLMSRRETDSDGGIPYLKDIPVVGNLFKNQAHRNSKTELIVMIVPYIVGSDIRARQVTEAMGRDLELLELPTPLRPGAAEGSLAPAVTTPVTPGGSPTP